MFFLFFKFINCLPNLEELSATNLELKKLNDLDASRCPCVRNNIIDINN